jgi:hypothetical protein
MAEERFHSLGRYLKKTFGERVHRLGVNIGDTSDALADQAVFSLNTGGTLGSAVTGRESAPLAEQIDNSKERIRKRYKTGKFIVHFHSASDASVAMETLSNSVDEVLRDNEVIGINFSTRPDCLTDEFIGFLNRTAQYIHTWLEIGIQTMHDETLRRIGMNHTREQARRTLQKLMGTQLLIAPHFVLGLPGETFEMMYETMKEVSQLSLHGINIHHFYVLKGADFERQYNNGELKLPDRVEYVNLVCDFIEMLPPHVVLHRIVGEADEEQLVGPDWTLQRKETLAMISAEMERRNSSQGSRLLEMEPSGPAGDE